MTSDTLDPAVDIGRRLDEARRLHDEADRIATAASNAVETAPDEDERVRQLRLEWDHKERQRAMSDRGEALMSYLSTVQATSLPGALAQAGVLVDRLDCFEPSDMTEAEMRRMNAEALRLARSVRAVLAEAAGEHDPPPA